MNKKTKIYSGHPTFYVDFQKPEGAAYECCKKISSATTRDIWIYVIETKSGHHSLGWSWKKPPSNPSYVAYSYFQKSKKPREIWAYYQKEEI